MPRRTKRNFFLGSLLTVCAVTAGVLIARTDWRHETPDSMLIKPAKNVSNSVGSKGAGASAMPGGSASSAQVAATSSPPIVFGMRKFPFPYDAMLAVSPDADHQTVRKFMMIHRFLNTTLRTPLGRGVGLDVADSFFPYNGSNSPHPIDVNNASIHGEMSYFQRISAKFRDASLIDQSIRLGWIDTMHSLGDFSMFGTQSTTFSRKIGVRALKVLKQRGSTVAVWTDHGNQTNVDDFGSYGTRRFYNYQQGANPSSPYYITDKLIPYGIHFVWVDSPSDTFGWKNIIYPKRLPNGRTVWAFSRYTNTGYTRFGAPEWNWTIDDLDRQLSIDNLMSIVRLHEYAIAATHLSADNSVKALPTSAVSTFRMLARLQQEGYLLVARTSRLLTYNVTQDYIQYYVRNTGHTAIIDITRIADPVFGTHIPTLNEVRGVTFYTSDPAHTRVLLNGHPIADALLQRNKSDGIHPSISIRWFPPDGNAVPHLTAKTT